MDALKCWHKILVSSLHSLPHDLSNRQMSILLTVYLTSPPHSVRHLAEGLNISKPAICRAIDQLEILQFLKRARDEEDRRTIILKRTTKGSVFLREFGELVAEMLTAEMTVPTT